MGEAGRLIVRLPRAVLGNLASKNLMGNESEDEFEPSSRVMGKDG